VCLVNSIHEALMGGLKPLLKGGLAPGPTPSLGPGLGPGLSSGPGPGSGPGSVPGSDRGSDSGPGPGPGPGPGSVLEQGLEPRYGQVLNIGLGLRPELGLGLMNDDRDSVTEGFLVVLTGIAQTLERVVLQGSSSSSSTNDITRNNGISSTNILCSLLMP
jgi:hypothetical protein